jgi:hypothetical protein
VRFGIGDKVLVKPSLAPGGEIVVKDKPHGVELTDAMREYANKMVTITQRQNQGFNDLFRIAEDGGKNLWWDQLFLPVPDKVQEVIKAKEQCGASRTSVPIKEDSGSNLQTFEARSMKRNMESIEKIVVEEIERRKKHIEEADPVAHPAHYTYGKIEVIDFIQDKDLNFALGNAVKYIVRAGHKAEQGMSDEEKAIQDLEKARQYIDFEIEHRKGVRG